MRSTCRRLFECGYGGSFFAGSAGVVLLLLLTTTTIRRTSNIIVLTTTTAAEAFFVLPPNPHTLLRFSGVFMSSYSTFGSGTTTTTTSRPLSKHYSHSQEEENNNVAVVDEDRHPVLNQADEELSSSLFPRSRPPPYLALITERHSCDSDKAMQSALEAFEAAVSTKLVDLVSVRINNNNNNNHDDEDAGEDQRQGQERFVYLVEQLMSWSRIYNGFRVVVSSDWIEPGIQAGAHGVHFKETHRHRIPEARALWQEHHQHRPQAEKKKLNNEKDKTSDTSDDDDNSRHTTMLVGTSTHTIESALSAYQDYQVDYFFAGTCFETKSHPEKMGDDLEGPALPAQVSRALRLCSLQQQQLQSPQQHGLTPPPPPPPVLAIGGLDATNCREQMTHGHYVDKSCADGIATISAVLQAHDPGQAVQDIVQNMIAATSCSSSSVE